MALCIHQSPIRAVAWQPWRSTGAPSCHCTWKPKLPWSSLPYVSKGICMLPEQSLFLVEQILRSSLVNNYDRGWSYPRNCIASCHSQNKARKLISGNSSGRYTLEQYQLAIWLDSVDLEACVFWVWRWSCHDVGVHLHVYLQVQLSGRAGTNGGPDQ